MKRLYVLLIGLIILSGCKSEFIRDDAMFVWEDSNLEERIDYVMFRTVFDARQGATAEINIFADSRYHLIVNESFVNFGPARFYPANPRYDTYDISQYLIEGENVIGVKVLSNGMNTYQVPLSQAGFIAWGGSRENGKPKHSFSTPGNWKCMEMKGFDRGAPKMSFATGAIEIYNAQKDPQEWLLPGFNDERWDRPNVIDDQEYWGDLLPRSIPHLTQDKRSAEKLLGIYSLRSDEKIYSFRVESADRTREEFGQNKYAFAYTYIYSPVKQQVRTGLWWGEHWLNGKGPLKNLGLEPGKPVRSDIVLDLEEGWNFFFIKYGIVWASWNFYMAVPNGSGLDLSPVREISSETIFMTAGPFTSEEEQIVRNLPLPFESPDDLPELSAGWIGQTRNGSAANPAWEIAWSYPDSLLDISKTGDGILIEQGDRVALVYDMGAKTLGRIYADIEADSGTIIDIAFSEDLRQNRPWVLKRAGIFTGMRYVTRSGTNNFESFKPYGARYLQVNISNFNNPVRIKDFGMISQVYPFDKLGSFECSDTMLNAIWELGWRTLRVCSEDSYTDTPFRERGLYAGDALPEYAITLATSGDSRLMKQSILVFSDMYRDLMIPGEERVSANVNDMADFPLITLLSYVWAVNRTNDLEFAERHYDGYRNMLKTLSSNRQENGLLNHGRAFIEWTAIDKNATLTAIQSLAVQAYRSMAYVAKTLDKPEDVKWYKQEAEATLTSLNLLCWDDKKGAYRDGFKDGIPIDNYFPISSLWPSLFGQTTVEQEQKLKEFYRESLANIGERDRLRLTTPYGGFYVLGGLYRHGYTEIAESFMKKYWSPMILKHNDTAWENFGDGSDGSGQGTLSHAWSGGPTFQMSAHILGVDMGFPVLTSLDTIVLRPQAATVTWARGEVPHPDGIIEIEWHIEGDKLYYNCTLPESVNWSVQPMGALADKELWINNIKSGS